MVRIWDVTTGKEVGALKVGDRISRVAFSSDGKTLASGAWDRTIRQRNVTAARAPQK
jgi:WD40 repeat protein